MRYGDMSGRFEGVYDEKGEIILKKGEVILAKKENVEFDVIKGYWASIGGEVIFDGSLGPGTFYRTNKRIVFIRKPDWQYKFRGGALGIPRSIADAYKARDLNKMGFYEFFELDYEEVDAWTKEKLVEIVSCHKKYNCIYLKYRGVKYIINIFTGFLSKDDLLGDLREKYNKKLSFWERWTKAKVEPDF